MRRQRSRHLRERHTLGWVWGLGWVLCMVSGACGAKTGLDTPDASIDAAPGTDAGTPVRCIEVPADGSPVVASFEVPVSLAAVDAFFLVDATASMTDEIDNIRAGLRSRVVPGIRAAIPDAQFGVGLLGEFPVEPHGPADVKPYELRVPMTSDVLRVEGALSRVPTWGNFDDPEALVEALYQVATGEGLPPYIPPLLGCPSGGFAGVCFRDESLPVVVLITDAPFHNGPPVGDGGELAHPYGFSPPPHTYPQAIAALRKVGARVLGLGARDPGRPSPMAHVRATARDTGTVDAMGNPLAFNIGSRGNRVGEGIVAAIEGLASGLPLDIDAVALDVPGDRVDGRLLVRELRPQSARPEDGVREIAADRFTGARPGTVVTFELVVDTSALPDLPELGRVPVRVVFRAFGRSVIGSQQVVILLGGATDPACAAS